MILAAQGKKPIRNDKNDDLNVEFDAPLNMRSAADVMEEYNQNAFANWNDKVLDACPNCDRTFVPRALAIHLKSCKPGKPLKPKLGQPKQVGPIKRAPVQIHEFKPIYGGAVETGTKG